MRVFPKSETAYVYLFIPLLLSILTELRVAHSLLLALTYLLITSAMEHRSYCTMAAALLALSFLIPFNLMEVSSLIWRYSCHSSDAAAS